MPGQAKRMAITAVGPLEELLGKILKIRLLNTLRCDAYVACSRLDKGAVADSLKYCRHNCDRCVTIYGARRSRSRVIGLAQQAVLRGIAPERPFDERGDHAFVREADRSVRERF